MTPEELTDFGFQKIGAGEKTRRVRAVFDSVAHRYDVMNDLMSLGVHRLWKRYAVHVSGVRPGSRVLDVAGGTGDMAALFRERVGPTGRVVISDINFNMLVEGRDRLTDRGAVPDTELVQADAQSLPFREGSFDCVCIAFGLRNVTDKAAALRSMYKTLRYGGTLLVLEFSRPVSAALRRLYDSYSFNVIPRVGALVARDEDSYRYLIESIRMHPDQEKLKGMLEQAGFGKVDYHNLSGGIVAVHKGYRI